MSEQRAGYAGEHGHGASTAALAFAAVGIVFGDIGTSPLYTIQECFGAHGVEPTRENVLGVISQVVWAVTLVVTVKYLAFVMRADNRGEGGILALLALVPERVRAPAGRAVGAVALLVLCGAALLFGDGIITPAISVLSAMEGLRVATASLDDAVVPLTVLILVGLFAIQRHGRSRIARLFSPVMVAWFATIAVLGGIQIARHPGILAALSPHHALRFFAHHGFHGFKLLGSVVLAVTGGEALYADMGHFGRRPIRLAWLGLVFPALVLCYLGQGALLLSNPAAADGGYLPLAVGAVFLGTMVLWRVGREALRAYYAERRQTIEDFIAALPARGVRRTAGTAVFMASASQGAPPVLTHFVERVGALHEVVVLLTITTEHVPTVPAAERLEVVHLDGGFVRAVARFGFMDQPDAAAVVAEIARRADVPLDPARVTYFLGRETFVASAKGRLGSVPEGLFDFLTRNASPATAYFGIPPRQVVEIGAQIDL